MDFVFCCCPRDGGWQKSAIYNRQLLRLLWFETVISLRLENSGISIIFPRWGGIGFIVWEIPWFLRNGLRESCSTGSTHKQEVPLCTVCWVSLPLGYHEFMSWFICNSFILSTSIITFRERDLGAKMIIEMEGKKTRIVNIKVTALQHYRAEKLAA